MTLYVQSPLASYERAVTTAAELVLYQVSGRTIAFELQRYQGLTRTLASEAIREARARLQQDELTLQDFDASRSRTAAWYRASRAHDARIDLRDVVLTLD